MTRSITGVNHMDHQRKMYSPVLQDGKRNEHIALLDRFAAIPGLVITSSVCWTLLGLHLSNYRGSEESAAWLSFRRTEVTITVQVISHILGLIHVQVLCALLRTSFNVSIASKPFPIYLAQFIQAASTPRITWVLPTPFVLLLLLLVAASFVPAAIWSGAIAPTPAERITNQLVDIPSFEVQNASTLWSGNLKTAVSGSGLGQWMNNQGLFTYDAAGLKAMLQTSASDASATNNGPVGHAKLDATGFTFLQRSYGVGGAAGLIQLPGSNTQNWFTYQESGFKSNVSCFHNATSSFKLKPVADANGAVVYAAGGALATGEQWGGWSYMGYSDFDILGWGPAYVNTTKSILIQVASPAQPNNTDTWGFSDFNGMQCDIQFQPETFSVFVNNTAKRISTKPLNHTGSSWPAYADGVLDQVKTWLWALSYVDACVGGCQLGRAMRLNVNRLQNITTNDGQDIVNTAMEDFLVSLVDNTLVNLLNTRLVSAAPEATKKVAMVISVPSFIYGDVKFIYLIVVINTLISVVYLVECWRTRAWAGMLDLDVTNVCDLLIGAYRGSAAVQREKFPWGTYKTEVSYDVEPVRMSSNLLDRSTPILLRHGYEGATRVPILAPLSLQPSIAIEH